MILLYTRNCGNFLYRSKATQCLERTQRKGVGVGVGLQLFLNAIMMLKVFEVPDSSIGIIRQVASERICWFPCHLFFHTRRKLRQNLFLGHFDGLSGISS